MVRRIALTLGNVLLFWAMTMVILAISSAIPAQGTNAATLTGAIAAPTTFGLTLVFVRWRHQMPSDFGLAISRGTWLRFGIGLTFGAFLIAAQTVIMWFAGGVKWVATTPTLAMLVPILGYFLLATREELAFRGYPLRVLASETKPWLALLIVSALFVIEHKLGGASWPAALLGPGLGALVFGMAALATKGLALPLGLHAAWNIGDWLRGGKGDGGLWRIVVEPGAAAHADCVAWTSYAAVMLCAFAVLAWWDRMHRPGHC
jgi:membrane protease YdiL (CAAX protease family)